VLQNLDVENCLAVHFLGEQYSCPSLSIQAEQFIFRYFAEVVETEEYLNLPFDRLSHYLMRDELSMPSEEAVFQAIVRWIEHDPEAKSVYIGPLLSSVRLQLIPSEFIAKNVHKYVHIKSSDLATQLVLDAYQWHCLPEKEKKGERKEFLRNKAIYPSIFIFGGDDGVNDGSPYNMVAHLSKNQQEWVGVEKMRRARSVFGSAVIRNSLFVVGGFDGERAMDSAEVFDCATNSWSLLPPLLQRRCSCSCAVLRGQLYVIGGVCGPLALSHVEKYDSVTKEWMSVTPLSETRSACGVASIGDYIYVVGGINSQGATINTGEVYSYTTQEWKEIAQMSERRRSLALCALNGQLYAIGGNNGSHDLRSCEVYDPIKNTWRPIHSMINARMYCSAATFDGEIFAAGGVEEASTLMSIERYDPQTGMWTSFISLPRMMCGSGMQVLDSVPLALLQPSKRKALHVDALLGTSGKGQGTEGGDDSATAPAEGDDDQITAADMMNALNLEPGSPDTNYEDEADVSDEEEQDEQQDDDDDYNTDGDADV
jgi:N-acetylneuraminic acid mutarotase